MNSGYIRSLLQKIRKVHKGAAGLAPMIVMLIFFMCIFLSLVFRKGVLQYDYERLDSGLTYALLAGAVINLEEYAVSGNIIIADSTRPEIGDNTFMHSYYHFLDSLRADLGLDEGMNFAGTPGLSGSLEVMEYKVYNYIRQSLITILSICHSFRLNLFSYDTILNSLHISIPFVGDTFYVKFSVEFIPVSIFT